MRVVFVAAALLACAACARPVERGEALYQDGRYVEAAETFERSEQRLTAMPPDACAAFGLYRGLTYLRLDDVENARKWLAYAYSVERKSPGMLLPEQRRLLDRGWAEVDVKAAPPPADATVGEQKIAATVAPVLAPPTPEAPQSAGPTESEPRPGVH